MYHYSTTWLEVVIMTLCPDGAREQIYILNFSYFYDQHNMRAEKFSEGWFEYKSNKVAQLQQILFIIFTIVGFILCILSIALRADMWFKDEWSSFILGTFVPYIVSTCLAAVIYLHESGHGGLRYKNRTSK